MSLQGAWRFEEGSGTTSADMSGNGLTATTVPGWTASGHTGGGLALNGTTAGAAIAISSDFDFWYSSTFMCWVRFTSFGAGERAIIYGPRYSGQGYFRVYVTAAGQLQANWGSTINGPTLSTNTWYHVAFAFDWAAGGGASNSKLYVDGVQVASGEGFPIAGGTLRWGGPSGSVMNGTIDDARWDSEQLSQAQIQSYMNTPVPGPLESSNTTRFTKGTDGQWKPAYTRRIVGTPPAGTVYGWQLTKHNTGLNKYGINGNRLPMYTGSAKPAAGAVIRGKKITTALDLSNGNITIERCLIQPTGAGAFVMEGFDNNAEVPAPNPITIRDCTIEASAMSEYNAAWSTGIRVIGTITGNYISGFGSGIAVMGLGNQHDCLIEGNYVANLRSWGDGATDGNHCDAFTIRDFSNAAVPTRQMTVQNNRFDCTTANATGACFLQTYSGRIDNTLVQGNLLEGGGYNFGLNHLNHPYSNIRSINNRFTPTGFGTYYVQGGSGFTQWSENYMNNPAQPDNKGAAIA